MIPIDTLALFALASLILGLTPGPNWLYLLSRTMVQGRRAGLVSLAGTTTGLLFHGLCAVFGLTVVLLAIPYAFDAIRLAGAAYLLWLAWSTLRGAGVGLEPRPLPPAPASTLFRQAILTSVLNPKVAIFYLSLLPQFIDPARGPVLGQSLTLAAVNVAITASVDGALVLLAASLARWVKARPAWLRAQRLTLGGVFGGLALWLAFDRR